MAMMENSRGGRKVYSIGIDIGYSSVKAVLVNGEQEIKYAKYVLHKGKVKETLKDIIGDLPGDYRPADIIFGSVTGSGSKFLTESEEATFVNEVAAVVEGSMKTNNEIKSIIEIGGESAKYITGFSAKDKSRIEIAMNSNCSAGTGSFLEEQMSRLNLRLEDYSLYAGRARSIPRIAGRCSVFAKTDITHHQQEGVSVEDILLGLAYAVTRNYKGAVMKKLPLRKPILFIGGVAHNQGIITALKDVLHLDEGDLIIPDYSGNVGAYGAAVIAEKDNIKIDLMKLLDGMDSSESRDGQEDREVALPKLISFGRDDSLNKHVCNPAEKGEDPVDCYLGVDVGSTSTNLVLVDEKNEIIAYKYLRTLGNPAEAVRTGLKVLKAELGSRVNVIGAGTTGSGRYMIGELIGADLMKDEITAQAKAAVTIDKDVDTIFEIGGQDSKYISLEDGIVKDFQMNKICAAGTGSFIEEQAKKFNIPIKDFGNIALGSDNPIHLGERCTVFIETSIAANLAGGANIEDIASGLCYAIAKNYLGRVVGQKKIGNKIFFQGGVAFNQGVINAFRALTGKDILVPPFFSITGAYGAAILAKEEMGMGKTRFKGFDIGTKEPFIEGQRKNKPGADNRSKFDEKVKELIFEGYDGTIDCEKKTVGIPRALFTYGMFPMFNTIFKTLGFNVVLSGPTDEETIRRGQQYALDETCYPVKLITGHVAELVEKRVDYIFFPDLFTVDHPGSASRQNYGCAYMQLAFKLMKQTMELEKKGIELLSPTIAFSLGKKFMMESFSKLGQQLGKNPEQTVKALQKGMEAFHRFEERMGENGQQVLQELRPDEKAFVIISKIYGVADPILNMGIPAKLMDMGYKVLSFYDLPEGDLSKEHPNMFWPFGQHILEPAQLVKQHPNLYAILLTHHGCGPDSAVSHYFREEMGRKPYLHIEVDEHSSGVGVITRLEAFINSLKKIKAEEADDITAYVDRVVHKEANIKKGLDEIAGDGVLYLPYLYPYSEIFKEILVKQGINTRTLPKTSRASVDLGRKFMITEEYFSLTALLGDVFKALYRLEKAEQGRIAFLIPQNEGTEVDGQYNRMLRTKLDEEGFKNVDIIAPFMEDVPYKEEKDVQAIYLGLLAGDLVKAAYKDTRARHLTDILDLVKRNRFEPDHLNKIASEIREELKMVNFKKTVLATGEALVLYNDFLNDFTFSDLEDEGHRVVYSPVSEAMWMMWRDFADQNENEKTPLFRERLDEFAKAIGAVSLCLSEMSPFERDLNSLVASADRTVGYYAGANGRYREAKLLGDLRGIDGIITVASMYENTGIVMNVLHKGFAKDNPKPMLHLTFDGNRNENDETKIESFMYYL
ncbi:MAG: acyl-CoA dehydratase activase [Firmicutes bacterium]|nr:acyl-CoA dehydratase activase [Bacillota bacterium]